ncbi:MAG: hypothetical protein ACRC3K_08845 [Plesiomonas sp.]
MNSYRVYYTKTPKGTPKERVEQVNCISWLRYHYPEYFVFHPVNESDIPVNKRVSLKQEGLLSGVPDIVCLTPAGGYRYGLFEIKRSSKSDATPVSENQAKALNMAANNLAFACVCYGFEEFKKAWADYISGK